jgi:hypothetical protein
VIFIPRGGETILRQLFEPLGYEVTAEQLPLDEQFAEWGASRYFNVTLRANVTCATRGLCRHAPLPP